MRTRKEATDKVIDANGKTIDYKFFEGGLLLEDEMLLYMRHYLYELTTGKSAPLETTGMDFRKLKNYWMRLYVSYKDK